MLHRPRRLTMVLSFPENWRRRPPIVPEVCGRHWVGTGGSPRSFLSGPPVAAEPPVPTLRPPLRCGAALRRDTRRARFLNVALRQLWMDARGPGGAASCSSLALCARAPAPTPSHVQACLPACPAVAPNFLGSAPGPCPSCGCWCDVRQQPLLPASPNVPRTRWGRLLCLSVGCLPWLVRSRWGGGVVWP